MLKDTLRYFDYKYYLRFAAIFFSLYLSYTFVIAAAAPTGTYYPFVDRYLNFPLIIRYLVLHGGQFLLSVFGYASTITEGRIVSADGQSVLEMAWPCYGLGLKSFWIAFVCAHQMPLNRKVWWSVLGIFTVFFLNCIRVAVMMIAMIDKWTVAESLGTNAHDFFNYLCYAVLFGLVLFFYAKAKTGTSRTVVAA